MRVVHVLHQYPPEFRGGTEACVEAVTRAQAARGDEPIVVAGSDRRSAEGEIVADVHLGVPVHRVLRRPGENYSVDHRCARVAEQVVALVRSLAPDVVHLHHTLNLSGDLAPRLAAAGLTVVGTLHDFTPICARFFLVRPDGSSCAQALPLQPERCHACVLPDFPAGPEALAYELGQRALTARAHADALALALVPSRVMHARWTAAALFEPAKLVVLPHASPLAEAPAPPRRSRADGRLVLTTWGHLAPAKGVLDLLEALRLAADPRLALLVFGEPVDADFAERLLDAAEGLDVSFGGRYEASDLEHVARHADLAVFPSRAEETFGLVVAEARAVGLPVIVSDRGALSEGVGEAGTTVPAADPPALAALLRELLADPARLEAWAGATRADLASPAAHADALDALYARALGAGGVP